MIKFFAAILWFLLSTKLLFFWLWLWQLKEYHWGRFLAHFEAQKTKKIISSFWRIKFPKFTKKILVIATFAIFLEILVLFWLLFLPEKQFYFFLLVLIILAPALFSLLVLLFQIPTLLLQKQLLKKARQRREKFKELIVIGITGSYGKTSTKEFLAEILSRKFKVLKTRKHINAEVGIAQAILKELKEDHQIFVSEIGAYNRGKIREVCQFLQPQIGILTGINQQHMATFGSQENIIRAKFELLESLPEEGMAIMNWDNQFIKSKVKSQKSKLQVKSQKFYSTQEKANVWAEEIKIEKEKISFKAFSKDGDSAFFEVNLIGGHNIPNILAAVLVAHQRFGFSLSEIAEICKGFGQEMGAMVLKKNREGLNIIESTYSANPDGVISALDYLKVWQRVKRIIVIPCLIELGRASREIHQRIGRKIGEICDLAIITTKDRFQQIKQGAREAGMREENIFFIEEPAQIAEKIKQATKPGDVVLLEGRVPKAVIDLLIQ